MVYTHGMLDPWFKRRYPLKHLKKMLYWPWAEYRVLREASAVLFTCEEERVLARQSFRPYRCNEVVVKYGTAGPQGDPQVSWRRSTESIRSCGESGWRCLWDGCMRRKAAIFCCRLLRRCWPRCGLASGDVRSGPGWLAGELTAMAERLKIAERVTWAGMVSGDLKWGAVRAAEVFVLPSHQENFGIVVAEALACGTPALISNKVNIWREVQRRGAGIVGADDLDGPARC